MRKFDGHRAARARVGGAKNRGHSASSDKAVDAVVIELVAGMD
jgi:hypothetical protein